jgi:hypothetical protein
MELHGDANNLDLLAEQLEFPDDSLLSPIYHIHIEYYPEHFFLAPDSVPLIVSPRPVSTWRASS